MKYYSEILNKFYDEESVLKNAEDEFHKEEMLKKEKASAISKDKKILADAIEAASLELDNAYESYEECKKRAKEVLDESDKEICKLKDEITKILNDSNDKAQKILDSGIANIKKAQTNKSNAIKSFNDKYGIYTVNYTGEKATKEFNRINKYIDGVIENMLNHFII